MGRKQGRKEPAEQPESGPQAGQADFGGSLNPMGLPEDSGEAANPQHPTPAPAPGVPLSDEEYERLKKEAARRSIPPNPDAQEDRPQKLPEK